MPFELRDFQDLVRLLRDHPEWREELRALLLTQELLTLPTLVRGLAETVAHLAEEQRRLAEGQQRLTEEQQQVVEGQQRLTETVTQLANRMDQLTETVAQLANRMDQLTDTVAQLANRMDQLTETVAQLTNRMDQLTETVAQLAVGQRQLTEGQQRIEVQLGEVRGWALEQRYRTHAPAYFGRFLRQVQTVDVGRLADALRERLEEREVAEVLLSDLILTGRLRTPARAPEIRVVLEVSTTVDRADVERAQRRAALLRQARYPAVAVAAGTEATAGAHRAASEGGVALLLDGRIDGWQEALDRMLPEEETGAS
jgi:hypothetical protein